MTTLHRPAQAPWLLPTLRDIEREFRRSDEALRDHDPAMIQTLEADLPPAGDNIGRQRLVTDLNGGTGMVVFSNGTDWIRSDTGAAL